MKKLIAVCMVLGLLLSCAAAETDLSALSFDELLALREKINAEMEGGHRTVRHLESRHGYSCRRLQPAAYLPRRIYHYHAERPPHRFPGDPQQVGRLRKDRTDGRRYCRN